MTIAVIALYLLIVLAVGLISRHLFKGTGEDFFVATRTIGPFVLFMTLFGTHMTAFTLLGASAQAYLVGIGVFGLLASTSALVAPAIFLLVGTRVWAIGKKHGYLTPVQYFRERWDSGTLGLILFTVLVLFLLPYLLIGVMGGGIALEQISRGEIPQWVGSLGICLIVAAYVTSSGMRATTSVNTFQTFVFICLAALAFLWITFQLGGIEEGIRRVQEVRPDLLVREGKVAHLKMMSYLLIPVSVGAFPHIFMHWLTARRSESFQLPIVLYPHLYRDCLVLQRPYRNLRRLRFSCS